MNNIDLLFWICIAATFLIVTFVDLHTPKSILVRSFYIIPILIAAYRFKPLSIIIVGVVAIILLTVLTPYTERISLPNIVIYDFGIILFTFLSIQFSLQRQRNETTTSRLKMFMQMISHDVRQPVTAAQLYAHIIERKSDPKVKQLSIKLLEEIDYLQILLLDLENIAQASTGRLSIHPIEMDLSPLLLSVVQTQQKVTKKKYNNPSCSKNSKRNLG